MALKLNILLLVFNLGFSYPTEFPNEIKDFYKKHEVNIQFKDMDLVEDEGIFKVYLYECEEYTAVLVVDIFPAGIAYNATILSKKQNFNTYEYYLYELK